MLGAPATPPRATVIVVGDGPPGDCAATLDDVRAQSESRLEVVVLVEPLVHEALATMPASAQPAAARRSLDPHDRWHDVAAAIAAARGDWVAVLHAGDRLAPNVLARALDVLGGAPDARLAVLRSASGDVDTALDGDAAPHDEVQPGLRVLCALLERGLASATPLLFARDAARASGVLDEKHDPAPSGELALAFALCLAGRVSVVAGPPLRARAGSAALVPADGARGLRVDAARSALGRLRRDGWRALRERDDAHQAFAGVARALLRSGFAELEPYARELVAALRASGATAQHDRAFARLYGVAPELARAPRWASGRLDARGAEAPGDAALAPLAAALVTRFDAITTALADCTAAELALAATASRSRAEAQTSRERSAQLAKVTATLLAKLRVGERLAALLGRPGAAPTMVDEDATGTREPAESPATVEAAITTPAAEPPAIASKRAQLRDILALHPDRRGTVIFAPTLRWSHELFQRPHQLALEHARQGDLVFFGETLWTPDDAVPFRKLGERLYATEVEMEVLSELDAPIVYFLSYNLFHLGPLTRPRTVYELIDELEVFAGDPDEVRRTHERLLDTADVVVATAGTLLEQVRARRPDAFLCPNAVDDAHFARAREPGPPPDDLAALLRPGHPVIGYYGALARWVDYDLLRTVARERPDLELVLIGPDYDGSLAGSGVLDLPNVHRLDARPYAELPRYLRAFDVAMIPFLVNDVTESTSPIKLYEYLSAGKPVVTTAMRECREIGEILIAGDAMQFVERIAEALALRGDARYLERSAAIARANTWQARVDALRAAANAAGARRDAAAGLPSRTRDGAR